MKNNKSIKRGLKEKIISLADKGLSYHQIQKRLGCSKSTISYHLGEGQKYKAYMRVRKHRLKKKIGSRSDARCREPRRVGRNERWGQSGHAVRQDHRYFTD